MTEAIAVEADALFNKGDLKGNHEVLTKAYNDGNRDAELLWRLVRSYWDLAQEIPDKEERKPNIDEAFKIATEALEKDDQNFGSHKWFAIALSSKGDYVATKEKIADAFKIRDHFKKAAELNPKDSGVQHCLAMSWWKVLQIERVERQTDSRCFACGDSVSSEAIVVQSHRQRRSLQEFTAVNDVGGGVVCGARNRTCTHCAPSSFYDDLPTLTFHTRLCVVAQIAAEVESMHAKVVVHGAICSMNVMVARDADGVHAWLQKVVAGGIGTIPWTSPKRLRAPTATIEAVCLAAPEDDVYSIGMLFVESLTGDVPYGFNTPAERAQQWAIDGLMPPLDADTKVPGGTDEATVTLVKGIILACLQPSPERPTASLLRQRLASLIHQ